jgi:hypothetical protein
MSKYKRMLMERYEPLVKQYANKVWNLHKLGMERVDLEQEIRLKMIELIDAYTLKFAAFKRGEAVKPIPLQFYLKSGFSNFLKDLTKKISNVRVSTSIDMNCDSLDYAMVEGSHFVKGEKGYEVNGFPINDGLTGKEKEAFDMYVEGFNYREIKKILGFNPSKIVKRQREHIKHLHTEIAESKTEDFVVLLKKDA